MSIRAYAPERDRDSAHRIWHECGWLDPTEAAAVAAMDVFIEAGAALVAELEGAVECIVGAVPGALRHLDGDLPLSVVTSVCTSRVARRRGLAGRLTAAAVAESAAAGACVSALCRRRCRGPTCSGARRVSASATPMAPMVS